MKFTDGMEQALRKRDLPIITNHDFFVLGHELFTRKAWCGEPLKRMPRGWDPARAKSAIKRMEERKALIPDSDFRSGVWRVTQATRAGSAEEVACIADPFAYVSHLSAMQRYGLTERSPKALHLTTPRRDLWNALWDERVRDDLPDIDDDKDRPVPHRPGFRDTIRRRPVVVHSSSHPWSPVSVGGEETRITSIGQTFADMITEPGSCGGMRHVLDVWGREAGQWLPEIVEAVDQLSSKIAMVRAGYILSELLGFDDPAIARWEAFAQRGGSRKLDPEGGYLPEFSERWMISLNV